MGTEQKSVRDEKRKLTAEELGKIQKKSNEIVARIEKGVVLLGDALDVMQKIIIEGESSKHLDVVKGLAEIFYPVKKWWGKNGVIYFKVISDGTTGEAWIERLEKQGFKLSRCAKELLLSEDFKATTGIVYEIAVLKGDLFTGSDRITKKIRSEAAKRKLITPNPEVACLIREIFSDDEIKAMGLSWIVTFHKPIKDSDGDLDLLYTPRYVDASWLGTRYDDFGSSWDVGNGFAFEVSRRDTKAA